MKLDRNLNKTGVGKYALLKLRQMRTEMSPEIYGAVKTLETAGILDWGNAPETEFFVMRLKDEYAHDGLRGYAMAAEKDGAKEYAGEVYQLVKRAGPKSPFCKKPD